MAARERHTGNASPSSNERPPEREEVAVLVPAAGEGARMGGERKQFRELGGQPVLVQTLCVFEQHAQVDHIIVAAPSEQGALRETSERLYSAGLTKVTAIVDGGASRQASVRRALRAVPASVDIVLVHDAVRPFLRSDALTRLIDVVRETGAAALAIPVADTLRRAAGGSRGAFGETVPRSDLYRMQTPQGFRRDWLEAAHQRAMDEAEFATDDVELVQRLGHAVRRVEGHAQNFKITTPDDWVLAQRLWSDWARKRPWIADVAK